MSRVKLGVPNYIEPAWAALSLGSWGSTLANVRDPDFGNPAISSDATTTSTQFAIDFSALSTVLGHDPGCDALFIPVHNLTASATIRVQAGTAAFTSGGAGGGTVVYDSTAVAALSSTLYPSAQRVAWAQFASGAADPVMDAAYNRGALLLFGATKQAKFWWVGISDTGNPAGTISIGRLFLGPLYQPSLNFDLGVAISFDGKASSVIARSGAEFVDDATRLRRLVTMSFSSVPQDEAFSLFMPLIMYAGFAKQWLFVYDPSDTYQMPKRAFMCTTRSPGQIAQPQAAGWAGVSLTGVEVI